MALGYTGLAADLLEMVKKQTLQSRGFEQVGRKKTAEAALKATQVKLKPLLPDLAFTLNALMLGNYSTKTQAAPRHPFKALPHYCYGNAFAYSRVDPDAHPVVGGCAFLKDYFSDIESYEPYEYRAPDPLYSGNGTRPLFTEHGFNVLPDGAVIDTTLDHRRNVSFFMWHPVPDSVLQRVDLSVRWPGYTELEAYLVTHKKSLASHWPHILKYVTTP